LDRVLYLRKSLKRRQISERSHAPAASLFNRYSVWPSFQNGDQNLNRMICGQNFIHRFLPMDLIALHYRSQRAQHGS